ncbi:hypothetical protein [Cryobacterium cryoconiti]|uniref:DoxX family protein n=1 Tax=Cryobacterium cryoconiti TaxID=1259239 RepID=A0A4Y8JU36_9MICO|nr:hypothetical protein [Cryobacterium cryoconiti]TFD30274.1 hypothetical protein E3T49_08175 [Cryobacterium cryoconiti]
MERVVVALAVYAALAGLALWRPNVGRIAIGIFFALMAVVVNGLVLTVAPGLFVAMAEEVPFLWYRELMLAVVSPLPQAFGVFMVVFELTIAALILSRGTARLTGLLVGAAFLVGITPLGLYTVTNLLLAATLVYLFWIDPANPWRLAPTPLATGSTRRDP